MRELLRRRVYGAGITEAEVLATRTEEGHPLPLPPLEALAPYSVATAERRVEGGVVEVRLWMSERDAGEYLDRRAREGGLFAGAVLSVLPSRIKPDI